jgi:hypothetical protein
MHRQRFGYAAVFGWSPPGHEQGGGAKPPLTAAWADADAGIESMTSACCAMTAWPSCSVQSSLHLCAARHAGRDRDPACRCARHVPAAAAAGTAARRGPCCRDRPASADRAGCRQGRRPDLRSRPARRRRPHRRPGDLDATRRYHPAAAGPDRRGPPFRQLGRPRSVAPWSPRARRTENRLDKGRLPRPRVTAGATAKTGRKPRTTSGRGSPGH